MKKFKPTEWRPLGPVTGEEVLILLRALHLYDHKDMKQLEALQRAKKYIEMQREVADAKEARKEADIIDSVMGWDNYGSGE